MGNDFQIEDIIRSKVRELLIVLLNKMEIQKFHYIQIQQGLITMMVILEDNLNGLKQNQGMV